MDVYVYLGIFDLSMVWVINILGLEFFRQLEDCCYQSWVLGGRGWGYSMQFLFMVRCLCFELFLEFKMIVGDNG